ncbi:hypothetical protein ACFU7Y_11620 [Kitasatospora sp. NPDC057542]|uniref:hypothetical protein n=1 Tax=Kitasatospora sp. NPDC057542 TaxID=3346162 RepID=UPI0036852E77
MDWELAYRAVLAVDIEDSSGRGDTALMTIRRVLATTLRESFEQSRIDWSACLREDLGDGLRVTAPAGAAKAALIHPLVHEFTARLRAHNRTAAPATSIRVRMALHAGDLRLGPAGEVAGRPLEVLSRLLDAPVTRTALAAAPANTVAVLVLSQHFHEDTVPHGYPGIDPEMFREVTVRSKEFTAPAWLGLAAAPAALSGPSGPTHPPGLPGPSGPSASHGALSTVAASERPRGRSTMVNKASGQGVVYAVQNGDQHINATTRP